MAALVNYRAHLEETKNGARKELEKFKTNLGKDPMYAFKWAFNAMAAAAILEGATYVTKMLEYYETEEELSDPDLLQRVSDRLMADVLEASCHTQKHGAEGETHYYLNKFKAKHVQMAARYARSAARQAEAAKA